MKRRDAPFLEALQALVGKRPPAFCRGVYASRELDDDQIQRLQGWCADNARPAWATGLSMIEAADLIVDGAVENANIEPNKEFVARYDAMGLVGFDVEDVK